MVKARCHEFSIYVGCFVVVVRGMSSLLTPAYVAVACGCMSVVTVTILGFHLSQTL